MRQLAGFDKIAGNDFEQRRAAALARRTEGGMPGVIPLVANLVCAPEPEGDDFLGLFSQQFDFYRSKKTYRVQIAGFCFAGLAVAIVVITLGAMKVHAALGIKPGTPIQLIPHGWMILGIGSVAMRLVIALCKLLGMALNAVYPGVTG